MFFRILSDKLTSHYTRTSKLLQTHLHITLPLPLTTMEIFNTVQNFVTEKKIGEVMWMNEEQDKMEMGIVMRKENADETMKKIKEYFSSL